MMMVKMDKDFPLEIIKDRFMGGMCYDFYHFKYKNYNCFIKKVHTTLGLKGDFYYCSYLAIPKNDIILELNIKNLENWHNGCTAKTEFEEFIIFGDDYAHLEQYYSQKEVILNLQSIVDEMLLLQRKGTDNNG